MDTLRHTYKRGQIVVGDGGHELVEALQQLAVGGLLVGGRVAGRAHRRVGGRVCEVQQPVRLLTAHTGGSLKAKEKCVHK